MRKIILTSLSSFMTISFVIAQADTTISGVNYSLFSPGLWIEAVEADPWPSGYVHCGDPTEIVEVTSATGRIWMDRNLGASRIAQSSTDHEAYGSFFQWGRFADGHQCINWTGPFSGQAISTTTTELSSTDFPGHADFIITGATPPRDWRSPQNDNLWNEDNGINNICPIGFRLPTFSEWEEEIGAWVSQNADGAFSSPLKLSVAGSRPDGSGSIVDPGINAVYWSLSVQNTNARHLLFNSTNAWAFPANARAIGSSIRCIKE